MILTMGMAAASTMGGDAATMGMSTATTTTMVVLQQLLLPLLVIPPQLLQLPQAKGMSKHYTDRRWQKYGTQACIAIGYIAPASAC